VSDHLGELEVVGRIILKWLFDIGYDGVNWIYLAQSRVDWWFQ